MAFTPTCTQEIMEKLNALNPPAKPLLPSKFVPTGNGQPNAEAVLTDQGWFISSPANDWALVPFLGGL
jgi:hypothetical protein